MSIGGHRPSRVHPSLLATTAGLTTRVTLAGLVTVAVLASGPAGANPLGGSVAGGSATIQGQGTNAVTINQSSQNTVINWATFNIGQGQTTTFNQPNSTSTALNRVIGGQGPSFLDGTLTANGRVFIVNGDGILFGPNSSINTAGFLATTNNIRNEDFMAGKYNFNIPGRPDASIVNLGSITATSGGFAALVAPGVRNAGTITATLGTVSLAAGNAFTLDFYGDRLITLAVNDQIASVVKDVQTGQTLKSLVGNSGKLSANGGRVQLTAAAARAVVDSVINNKGVIEANSIGTKNGMIVLSGATGASKPKGAPTQTIKLAGHISAAGQVKGTKGGTVVVAGENIVLASASIDASGAAGGGKVLIGGDTGGGHPGAATLELSKLESFVIPTATTVSVDGASVINASATGNGSGGKVVLWSDQKTTFAGTILAQGGAAGGNGGFVETSGHTLDFAGGQVNTSAPKGKTGNWLLDPTDLTIDTTAASTISGNLATTNVLVQTNADGTTSGPGNTSSGPGDIIVAANIAWTSTNALELSAFHSVLINNAKTINSSGGGSLTLRADNTGSDNHGTVLFTGDHTGHINMSNGGSLSVFYNPSSFPNPDFAFGNVTMTGIGNLTAYALVNTATELQNINSRPQGTYALGRDIDASSLTSFVPIGNISSGFTGILEAQNHIIHDLAISSSAQLVGLFGYIGSSGVVRNLKLQNVTVTGTSTDYTQTLGLLAGQNDGSIVNVSTTAIAGSVNSVTGTAQAGINAGGLVGLNTGSISNADVKVQVTVGDGGTDGNFNYAGGLVGINTGTINGSSAAGAVNGGSHAFIGGLVGQNGNTGQPGGVGFIGGSSSASGAVTVADGATGSSAGGLVGYIAAGASVVGSSASSTVSGGDFVGGLAGQNLGSITFSSATGNVSGGTRSIVGGLVGQNGLDCGCDNSGPGTIASSFATGTVTTGGIGGGLVGLNSLGSVTQSNATGAVGGSGNVQLGGLVGVNDTNATIAGSHATGNVTGTSLVAGGKGGDTASVGGFAGSNNGTITNSFATGNVSIAGTGSNFGDYVGGGFVGQNGGTIQGTPNPSQFTYATGSVTGDANSIAGGFVGLNFGNFGITFAYASGAVHVGSNSYAGGFVAGNFGTISQAFATGAVTDDGNTVLGGFGAFNLGLLNQVFATGAVTGGTNNVVGGLVGVNAALVSTDKFGTPVGSIVDSYATGAASGGTGSIVGGLVGVNDGVIGTSYSAGAVSGGTTGGLVARNNPSFQFSDLQIPSIVDDGGSPVPLRGAGAITQSYWNTETSGQPSSAGGTGMTSVQLAAGLPAGFTRPTWDILPDPSFPFFPWAPVSTIPNVVLPPIGGPILPPVPPLPQIIDNLSGGPTLVSLPLSITVLPFPPPPPAPGPGPQQSQQQPVGEPRLFAVPPAGETRLITDEVVLMVDCDTPQSAIDAVARDMQLSILASQCLTQTHKNLLRMHINSGQTVGRVIQTMARYKIVALAQANFVYRLMQDKVAQELAQDPDLAGRTQEGDSAQYALGKLGLIDIHKLIKGTNISIAVIDSQIDVKHPDLDGVFADQYDAVGGAAEKPHPHGTGMAGAIAAHQRLMGIAPAARLYAIHAFSSGAASADSTTYNILKGLDWAASKGVRIINMSFAGPRDPSMERALKNAHDKGIVLIAAAGNAGPKSPPLFPGADPNVIAVTATDSNDKIFTGANRGRYIAVAAPGVDILVPAPDGTYQLTTGTSVSSAEVSGIVALLLERNPNLGPEDIRKILTTSAKHQGTKDRDDDFGSGLVDPSKAIQDAGALKPVGQPAKR